MKKSLIVVLLGLVVFGCSPRDRAEMAVRDTLPTAYAPSGGLFDQEGYRDQKLGENSYRIRVSGNEVTDYRRVDAMVRYRAAMLGRQLGYTHFSVPGVKLEIRCTQINPLGVRGDATVTYGSPSTLSGKVFDVEKVISRLDALVLRPNSSSQHLQRVFLANGESCKQGRFVRPEETSTNADISGENAGGKQTEQTAVADKPPPGGKQ